MKRFLIICVAAALLSQGVLAQHISERQAMDRALEFIGGGNMDGSNGMRAQSRDNALLKPAPVDAQGFYAFNIEGGGFVIASADERAVPILGYSTGGSLEWEQLPPNMLAWLKGCDDAIASLADSRTLDGFEYSQKDAIEPLIKTKWGQAEPFYNDIVHYNGAGSEWLGQVCYTGCGATAMAQIMNYFKWPQQSTASIPAYDFVSTYLNEEKVWHIDSLPPVSFDWNNMLDEYTSNTSSGDIQVLGDSTRQKAVSTLMQYCSQAIKSEYFTDGTGSWESNYPQALVKCFGYSESIRLISRSAFGVHEWEEVIYRELAAARPVLYVGQGDAGGHAFICDGYDGNGLFHINWGWLGDFNGFYSLSVIKPDVRDRTNIKRTGFGVEQVALIGIQPPGENELVWQESDSMLLGTVWKVTDNCIRFRCTYSDGITYIPVPADFALGTVSDDGLLTPCFPSDEEDSVLYERNFVYVEVDSLAISPGQSLKLYPMCRIHNTDDCQWRLLGGGRCYVSAGWNQDGHFYFDICAIDELNLRIVDMGCVPDPATLTVDLYNDFVVTVRNESGQEYNSTFYVALYYFGDVDIFDIDYDTPCEYGGYFVSGAYIPSGQETQLTFSLKPDRLGVAAVYVYASQNYSDGLIYLDGGFLTIEPQTTGVNTMEGANDTHHYIDLQGRGLEFNPNGRTIIIEGGRKFIQR